MSAFGRGRHNRSGKVPDPHADSLRDLLAETLGLSPENIIVYNGAGEALVWLFISNLLLQKGTLIVPFPSYERFVDAAKRCAEVVEVPLSCGDYSLPVEQFIEEGRRKRVTMGLLSNPNNPTGNLVPHNRDVVTAAQQNSGVAVRA